MSLRVIPLIILPLLLYIITVVATGHMSDPDVVMRRELFSLPLITGRLPLSIGDIIILATMFALFIELIKSTFTSTSAMIDHGLSMLVFILCLVMLLTVKAANTSVFFFIMIATLIDVVAGFMIGMRTARRDLNIGTDS